MNSNSIVGIGLTRSSLGFKVLTKFLLFLSFEYFAAEISIDPKLLTLLLSRNNL